MRASAFGKVFFCPLGKFLVFLCCSSYFRPFFGVSVATSIIVSINVSTFKKKSKKSQTKHKKPKNHDIWKKSEIHIFFMPEKNSIILVCHLRILLFDKISPVHPVSEFRGVPWALYRTERRRRRINQFCV